MSGPSTIDGITSGRRDVWRGTSITASGSAKVSTGFSILDRHLAGGWPVGALVEVLTADEDPGALWPFVPALAALSQRQQWLAWVAPPHIPYAPTLAQGGIDLDKVLLVHPKARDDTLWSAEQSLRSGTCSAVLFWYAGDSNSALRRLQLAAEEGNTLGLCYRPAARCGGRTTAALRLRIRPAGESVMVDILKQRGSRPRLDISLSQTEFPWPAGGDTA